MHSALPIMPCAGHLAMNSQVWIQEDCCRPTCFPLHLVLPIEYQTLFYKCQPSGGTQAFPANRIWKLGVLLRLYSQRAWRRRITRCFRERVIDVCFQYVWRYSKRQSRGCKRGHVSMRCGQLSFIFRETDIFEWSLNANRCVVSLY